MLPKGRYNARPIAISFGVASTGNEQVAVQFEIVDGEEAGNQIAYVGTFTDASIEYTTEALRALGWDGDDLAELPDLAANGRLSEAQIVVVHETYDGKERARVKFVNPPGGGRFAFKTQLEGNDLRQFAARMKSALRGAQQAGGSRQPQQRGNGGGGGRSSASRDFDDRRPPPADPDDSLPF